MVTQGHVRIEHLKTRRQFQTMLAHPAVAKTLHFALHSLPVHAMASALPPSASPLWVGALLPKRWAKHAVTRNLIRRQAYAVSLEFARAMEAPLRQEPQVVLLRLRSSFHPSKTARGRRAKAAARGQSSIRSTSQTPPIKAEAAGLLRSAASAPLRAAVRDELQHLLAHWLAGWPQRPSAALQAPIGMRSDAGPTAGSEDASQAGKKVG